MKKRAVNLMLDSGAYSAWTGGHPIKVKDYIGYVKDHAEYLWQIICLDVLPGKFGGKRTRQDVDIAANASYKNLQAMKDAGLKPIPVFHRGESFSWLERLLKDGETYIGLSPLVDSKEAEKRAWLDECFSVLTDSKGKPLVRTHGFGVTNPILMMRYPWFTVDSTAWVKGGGFGLIYVPVYEGGTPNYSRLPIRVHISDVSKKKTGGSFSHMGPSVKECVLQFLAEHGFSLAEIIYSRAARCAAMLVYFNGLEPKLPLPFKYKQETGFLRTNGHDLKLKPIKMNEFHIIHSTNLSNDQSSLLTKAGCAYRLLSYFELRDAPDGKLAQYVKDGMDLDYIRRQPPAKWDSRRYTSFRRMKLLERLELDDNGTSGLAGED